MKRSIIIPREVWLVEIERRCHLDGRCNARARVGLTKAEARAYCGFTCESCERWNEDGLSERDVPEWWEELAVTDLTALREPSAPQPDAPGEVILRLSDDYRKQLLEVREQGPVNEHPAMHPLPLACDPCDE